MKTKFLRIGKSSLSLTLSLMMIVTTVFFGSFGTADAITASDTDSVDVVEDVSAADTNADVEEDGTSADTTAADESSDEVAADDTAADDKSVNVDSSSVSTSVTTANTKKTEKKTPEVSKADAPVADGYARVYFANNIVTNWKIPKVYIYGDDCNDENKTDWDEPKILTKSSSYDGLYYIDLKAESNGSINGKLIFRGTSNGNGCEQSVDFGYNNTTPTSIEPGKVFVPTRIVSTEYKNGVKNPDYKKCVFQWADLDSDYCHKIYYDNSYTSWESVYAYCNGTNFGENKWPGVKMNDSNGKWYVNIYGDSTLLAKYFSDCLVFNNGNSDASKQTVNITNTSSDGIDKVWKASGITTDSKYTGTWTAYTTSSSSSTGSSANVDYHFIYGNNNDPRTFTNELPILKDSSNKCYVELPTEYGMNYYFGISGTTSYLNLYVNNHTEGSQDINVTNNSNSNVSTESKIGYNIGDDTYYCSRVSTKSASVERVIIYINEAGHAYTVTSNLNENITTRGPVTVIAKTGTVRGNYDKYSKLASISSLKYTDTNEDIGNNSNKTHWAYGDYDESRMWVADGVQRNREIAYTVHVKSAYQGTYYVKAFCVNGETYNIRNGASNDGNYTCKFTIDDDDEGPIEITPIYYYIETNSDDYITFSVEDFAGDVKNLWGNTLACYAYYVGGEEETDASSADKNALGGYPGQPMVYINGSYYMQIPKYLNGNIGKSIEGITLNNYAWDEIHGRKLVGVSLTKNSIGSITTAQQQAKNCQTYDYDDFVALRDTRLASRIIFSFKYRTYNNNDSKTDYPEIGNQPQESSSFSMDFVNSSSGNGWNALVDYYDVPVDLFARRLVDENGDYLTDTSVTDLAKDKSQDVVYVVSDGYVAYYSKADNDGAGGTGGGSKNNKYVGQYATRWYVYTKNSDSDTYKYIGALPPSAFLTGLTDSGDSATAKKYKEDTSAYIENNFLNYGSAKTTNKVDGEYNKYSTWDDYIKIYQACAGLPVVITYESNIYADGVDGGTGTNTWCNAYDESKYFGTAQNPGYRCDGRWYYSKANQTIKAQTKICIKNTDSNGNVTYTYDSYVDDTNVGNFTGATASFSNETPTDSNGNSFNGETSVTVLENEKESFEFTAALESKNTSTNEEDTYYGKSFKFIGWYLETGSGLLNPITTTVGGYGSRQMDSSATFVALYETVEPSVEKTLDITHELYSDLYSSMTDMQKEDATLPGNSTGTPYIDTIVVKDSNEDVFATLTPKTNLGLYTLTSDYLKSGYTLDITFRTVPTDSNTTFDSIYTKETGDNSDSYIDNTTAKNDLEKVQATKVGTINSNSITYTYSVDDLFPIGTTHVTLPHYSSLSTSILPINFKYYDRKVSNLSQPETIDTEATTITVTGSVKKTDSNEITTTSIDNAITAALEEATTDESKPMSLLKNIIDQYYFWTSTNDAMQGIGNMIDYHELSDLSNARNISDAYKTCYSTNYDNDVLCYHLDCYGVPYDEENDGKANAEGYTPEFWVSCTKTDGKTVAYYGSDLTDNNVSVNEVVSVTVWGYNVPRKYNITVYKPKDTDDSSKLTFVDKGKEPEHDYIYFPSMKDEDENSVILEAFYNQRLGGKDGTDDNKTSNTASPYLDEYRIAAYFGDDADVTARASVPIKDSENSLVFDGWYAYDSNAGTYTKISSDRTYGYRVTTTLTIIAGYKEEKSSGVKVSITKNGTEEPFIDKNNQSKVRLTTVVNVYNNLDTREIVGDDNNPNYLNPIDSDSNIKKVSAIYVKLPIYDTNGSKIQWTSYLLGDLKLDSRKEGVGKEIYSYLSNMSKEAVKDTGSFTVTINDVTYNEQVISYTYSVTFDSSNINATTTMLTNKNRVQFTLPLTAESYYGTEETVDGETVKTPGENSALIAYAAIYYETSETTTDAETGNETTTTTGEWILSENHAEFIAPAASEP